MRLLIALYPLLFVVSCRSMELTPTPVTGTDTLDRELHHSNEGDIASYSNSPRHHHLSITIDRDSPVQETLPDISPNRLRYKLAIVSAVTALISAGLTATVTILTFRGNCP